VRQAAMENVYPACLPPGRLDIFFKNITGYKNKLSNLPRDSPPQNSPPQHSYEGAGYEWAGYVLAGGVNGKCLPR